LHCTQVSVAPSPTHFDLADAGVLDIAIAGDDAVCGTTESFGLRCWQIAATPQPIAVLGSP
jgi:hypothetical protein